MARKPKLEPGISLVGKRYRVRLFVHGKQHSLGMFDALEDARAVLRDARRAKQTGTFVTPADRQAAERAAELAAAEQELEDQRNALTLAEWFDAWLEDLERAGKSGATLVTYRSTMRVHVLEPLGDVPLVEISRNDVDLLLGSLSGAVQLNVGRTLRSCLNAAVEKEGNPLEVSPFHFTLPGTRKSKDLDKSKVATPAQVRDLTAAMPERWAVAVPLAAWCALRLGEVLGLRRGDLEDLDDPERATVHVRRQLNAKAGVFTDPKADSARRLAIPASMVPALVRHLEQFTEPGEDSPLLTSAADRTRHASHTSFDSAWRAARDDVGMKGYRFHDLRHSGLTSYAQQGATLAELLERGGHADVSVALRYQQATLERDRALTAALDKQMGDVG